MHLADLSAIIGEIIFTGAADRYIGEKGDIMIVTVFSKKRTTSEGKKFTAYIGRLAKKDGTEITASVHFDEAIKAPADCPCCINVQKADANLSHKEYVREDTGEMGTRYDLWIKAYTAGPEYVDHSLDDFED